MILSPATGHPTKKDVSDGTLYCFSLPPFEAEAVGNKALSSVLWKSSVWDELH